MPPHLFAIKDTISTSNGRRYKVVSKLGAGGYGAVYEVQEIASKLIYALKSEDKYGKHGTLPLEVAVLTAVARHHQTRHFPALIDYDENDACRMLVTQCLGKNLDDVRCSKQCGGKLGVLDGVRVGLQLLAALRHLHLAKWLHRDVKPSNLCIGSPDESRVYLVDYGGCRRLVPAGKKDPSFRGTIEYAPPAAHRAEHQTRQDDLLSAIYSVIELISGTMPWLGYTGEEDSKMPWVRANFLKRKMRLFDAEKCKIELAHLPREFVEIFQVLAPAPPLITKEPDLARAHPDYHKHPPPYEMVDKLLRDMLKGLDVKKAFSWDWNQKRKYVMRPLNERAETSAHMADNEDEPDEDEEQEQEPQRPTPLEPLEEVARPHRNASGQLSEEFVPDQ